MEDLLPYHITWVTHNSRVSERMVQFGVKRGEPVVLNNDDEVEITRYIAHMVHEEELRVIAYNICRDHVHMILLCTELEKDNIIRKFKGKSAQLYKHKHGYKEEFHLWAQKYSYTPIESDEQMMNTIEYIQYNREKHNLPCNKGLQPLVDGMIMPFAEVLQILG
ncbi:MAG: transposase [Patescibacteria group bacterium]|jgi:REP element-mobilizing transposase RayT